MRSSTIADVVIYATRPELVTLATDQLKIKGVSNIATVDTEVGATDALERFQKALLIIDWELGARSVVKVLAHNRRRFAGQLRPILLVAPEVSEQVIATAAEYSVSQIFTEALSFKNLGARIGNLILGESMPDEIKDALGEAHSARVEGDFRTAFQILQRVLIKHPSNLRLRCEVAETLMQLGEAEKALKLLEGMEKMKPPYLRGVHLLGRCRMRLGRFQEALIALESANFFNPHDVDRLVDMGQALLQSNRTAEAAASFDAALAIESGHRNAKVGKGQCQLLQEHVNEALTLLKDVASNVELASIFNTCAVMSMRQGRHDAGMNLYLSAVRALGKDARIRARIEFNMGVGYRRWGKLPKALECFAAALTSDPSFSKAETSLAAARALLASGSGPDSAFSGALPELAEIGETDLSSDLGSLIDDSLEESLFSGRKPA